jgi:aminopeptidase YwaD
MFQKIANLILFLQLFYTSILPAQNLSKARQTIDTLCSKTMWGRGYTNQGMKKAADYIGNEFHRIKLKPINGSSFKQSFTYPVNTFPGQLKVSIDGKALTPGKDFIILPESAGKKTVGRLVERDSATFIDADNKIVVVLKDKLTWSVSGTKEDYTGIVVLKSSISQKPANIDLQIENLYLENFEAFNVAGMVKGTRQPDSLILFTAHYDHLGGMGHETFFPGANDNASGVAMLLQMAEYYAKHPQSYSMAFICFAGEEAGLLGSKYFTEHPLFPLNNIRFLINVDMVGTGDTGITVVNATEHPKAFSLLQEINNAGDYLSQINSRGKAPNSDHYYFTERGVPAFFIYTNGGIKAYHDIYDIPVTLPFTKFAELFQLIVSFNKQILK